MGEWIKVSERLPEAETEVLAYCTELKHKVQVLTFDENKLWWYYYKQNGRAKYWGITHWQKLPPPPPEAECADRKGIL